MGTGVQFKQKRQKNSLPASRRPVPCPTCGRMFSRQDSLKRHEKLHYTVRKTTTGSSLSYYPHNNSQQIENIDPIESFDYNNNENPNSRVNGGSVANWSQWAFSQAMAMLPFGSISFQQTQITNINSEVNVDMNAYIDIVQAEAQAGAELSFSRYKPVTKETSGSLTEFINPFASTPIKQVQPIIEEEDEEDSGPLSFGQRLSAAFNRASISFKRASISIKRASISLRKASTAFIAPRVSFSFNQTNYRPSVTGCDPFQTVPNQQNTVLRKQSFARKQSIGAELINWMNSFGSTSFELGNQW